MFSKVGEIFLAAGNAYSKLGDAVMTLYNCQDEGEISNPYNKVTGSVCVCVSVPKDLANR